MEIQGIINMITDQKEKRIKEVEEKKKNISKDYLLAKLDFVTIENKEDSIKTLELIEKELNELQKRIITRNKKEL